MVNFFKFNKLGLSQLSLGVVFTAFTFGLTAKEADKPEMSPTPLYQAIDVLSAYLSADFNEIADVTKKIVIVNYTQSHDLPDTTKSYVVKKIEQTTRDNAKSGLRIIQCPECLSVRAEAEGDEIFIKKGMTNKDELTKLLTRHGAKAYADINLVYAGRFLVLQMSIVDIEGIVLWSNEYKTHINPYMSSQWIFGAAVEAAFFNDAKIPSPKGARVYAGQKLLGIGAAGLCGEILDKTDVLKGITTYSGFFELSHNEFFQTYWDFLELSYYVSLGITDFNAKQQLAEALGVKTRMGEYFTLLLTANLNQFFKKPQDSSPIYNPKGDPVLKNNEPLPMRFTLGLGIEI